MRHPDPDDLALLALGERVGDPVDAHVAQCDVCQHEIESFQQTIGLADLSNYGEDAPPVSEHVWQAITAELGLAESTSTDQGAANGDTLTVQRVGGQQPTDGFDELPPAPPVLRAVPSITEPSNTPVAPSGPASRASNDLGSPLGAPGKRWSRWVAPLAAAVVGIALGAGAVAVLQNRSANDPVEAVAPLTPVLTGPLANKEGQQLGQADLVASPTGPQVRVTAADLPGASTAAYEVWLFGDDGKMVSLGTLSDGNGSFTVPPGINPQEYRVVDISDEPPDGNPAHSGISLVRGEFS